MFPKACSGPRMLSSSVAAAAVRSFALGLTTIDESDLRWAVEAILWAAENPHIDGMSYHETTFPMGADRAAAGGAPALALSVRSTASDLDRERIDNALRALATSLFDEVRAIYAKGSEPLWTVPCESDQVNGVCRRQPPPGWPQWMDSVIAGLAY